MESPFTARVIHILWPPTWSLRAQLVVFNRLANPRGLLTSRGFALSIQH